MRAGTFCIYIQNEDRVMRGEGSNEKLPEL